MAAMLIRTVDDIARAVRDRRKQLGLSQLELADRAGVSRQWLVDLEQGKRTAEVWLVLKTLTAAELQIDLRDPRHLSGSADAASLIDAGREVLERHRPVGTPLRTLRTRPLRTSGSVAGAPLERNQSPSPGPARKPKT
jgi:y4mF family transcriptional regulator